MVADVVVAVGVGVVVEVGVGVKVGVCIRVEEFTIVIPQLVIKSRSVSASDGSTVNLYMTLTCIQLSA